MNMASFGGAAMVFQPSIQLNLNLRNGITAPRSGSIEQNGSTMAEQIGGQIFIDSWGLVSPNNSIDFSSFKFHRKHC